MAATYETSSAGQAASFGWSLAVINSNPELKNLFAQATSGAWTADHFVAKVRDTSWFKTHADTARQAIVLQKADPATYNARVAAATSQATSMANTVGIPQTAAQLRAIGVDVVMYGWNTDQMRHAMSFASGTHAAGGYTGEAATAHNQINQLAGEYGLPVAPWQMSNWIVRIARGEYTTENVRADMIGQATSRYPSLADRLKAGETVKQIADPYIQSQAKILELNPTTIPVTDKLVQSALSGKDAAGKPATKSVWQFEQDLRQDPRFVKTQGAQDSSMAMAHRVLADFGVAN